MPIKMLNDAVGATDASGRETRVYRANEELPDNEFGNKLGKIFLDAGLAEETKVVSVTETKTIEPTKTTITGKRARNKKGQLIGDNPDTPNVNEAWEGGIAPK
tara:strand:+ start:207 stop:515 length:309 start_codon:yes stop_codon:yes gene_type:complete